VARPDQVFRAKGFLSIEGFDHLVLFQSVREIFNLTLSDRPKDSSSNLVVIGKHLNKEEYLSNFEKCVKSTGFLQSLRGKK
jgi:G3E family GTPase